MSRYIEATEGSPGAELFVDRDEFSSSVGCGLRDGCGPRGDGLIWDIPSGLSAIAYERCELVAFEGDALIQTEAEGFERIGDVGAGRAKDEEAQRRRDAVEFFAGLCGS